MYEIFLTDIHADGLNPPRVAELLAVDSTAQANEICIALQPFLRDGIEAHFVDAGDAEYAEDAR